MSDFKYCRRKGAMEEKEDLQEEEVWSVAMREREGSNIKVRHGSFSGSPSSIKGRKEIPKAAESAKERNENQFQSSAPVSIPDWSKIVKRKSSKNLWDDSFDVDTSETCREMGRNIDRHGVADDDDDESAAGEVVPPHEYLARRLAGTQIASFSMCEGVGRTLKGRDLSKLRNAILTKTGFLE